MSVSTLDSPQAIKTKLPEGDGFHPLFSSRGTRWDGLVVEKLRKLSADCPHWLS